MDENSEVPPSLPSPVEVPPTPLRSRFSPRDTQALYEFIHELLSDDDVRNHIAEVEFRSQLRAKMLERQVAVDDDKLTTRLRTMLQEAESAIALRKLHEEQLAQWERRRTEFLEEQQQRRRLRAERMRISRHRRAPVDSDEEYDTPAPILPITPLQLTAIAAAESFLSVKDRFAAEREAASRARKEQKRLAEAERKRLARRAELLSTAFSSPAETDSTESMSSSSSSPTPPKRRFTAAAVTSVYVDYMAQNARRALDLATELREHMRRTEEATAVYRERKLRSTEEYRRAKLALLQTDKENAHPNVRRSEGA